MTAEEILVGAEEKTKEVKEEKFSIREQAVAMTIAAGSSWLYAWFVNDVWFNLGLSLPLWPGLALLVLMLVLCKETIFEWLANNKSIGKLAGDSQEEVSCEDAGSVKQKEMNKYVKLLLRLVLAALMILQLGLIIYHSGGSFDSPFAQLLIACALFAPRLSNTPAAGIVITCISFGAFVFGGIYHVNISPDLFDGINTLGLPLEGLHALMLFSTAISISISLVITYLKEIVMFSKKRKRQRSG
jgi:hypothetical protein